MATAAMRRFLGLVGIQHPIVNAPMAGVAGGALAAAVTDAGALGFIGGGYGDLTWLDRELAHAGGRRVGVGFITWAVPDLPAAIDHVLARGVRDVFLSFGEPAVHVAAIHDGGARAWCQVQGAGSARAALDAGADVIVAQGSEAGGHGTDGAGRARILADVLALAGDVPVLATGGIGTLDDARAAVRAGAAGIVLGTRMYATREALDTDAAKQQLVVHSGADTVRTSAFDVVRGPEWPVGFNGRALRNDTVAEWEADEARVRESVSAARARYLDAARSEDFSRRVVWAGTSIDGVRSISPAADVVREFAAVTSS